MSHDVEPDVVNIVSVPVNEAEAAKLQYLIKVLDALDRADARAEEDIQHFRSTEGVRADRQFDWTIVTRHCAPQVLVSFLRGAERFEEERTFRMFPHSIIVPRTAQVVVLDRAFELVLEGHDDDNVVNNARDALRDLESYVQTVEEPAAANAVRLLKQLTRVLKIKL